MIDSLTFASLVGEEVPSTDRKKQCKFKNCTTILNRYQAKISNFCCVHETVMALKRMDEMADKIGGIKKK